MSTSEQHEKFTVTNGQLVLVKSIEFDKDGNFKPTKKYAIIKHNYSCDWFFLTLRDEPITVIYKNGIIDKVRPIKIEFIKNLSKKKIKEIIMEILLSV